MSPSFFARIVDTHQVSSVVGFLLDLGVKASDILAFSPEQESSAPDCPLASWRAVSNNRRQRAGVDRFLCDHGFPEQLARESRAALERGQAVVTVLRPWQVCAQVC